MRHFLCTKMTLNYQNQSIIFEYFLAAMENSSSLGRINYSLKFSRVREKLS